MVARKPTAPPWQDQDIGKLLQGIRDRRMKLESSDVCAQLSRSRGVAEDDGYGRRVLQADPAVSQVYGLTSQLQRAAVSMPANFAEGHSRQHTAELMQHLSIAYGALAELETHLEIAHRLSYINVEQHDRLLEQTSEIGRMINGLRRALQAKARTP